MNISGINGVFFIFWKDWVLQIKLTVIRTMVANVFFQRQFCWKGTKKDGFGRSKKIHRLCPSIFLFYFSIFRLLWKQQIRFGPQSLARQPVACWLLEELREHTVCSVSDLDSDWSVEGDWSVALCLSVLKKRLLPQFHRTLSIVLPPPFCPSVDSNFICLPIIFIRMTAGVQCDFLLFYPDTKPDFSVQKRLLWKWTKYRGCFWSRCC